MKNTNILVVIIIVLVIAFGGYAYTKNKGGKPALVPEKIGEYGSTKNITPTPIKNTTPPLSTPIDTTTKPVIDNVREFTVSGGNYFFSPNNLTVKKGDTVKIIFKNTNGFHDFRIDELEVATSRIRSGTEETITFVASKSGSFEYYCSVGGHRTLGMKGILTVQ